MPLAYVAVPAPAGTLVGVAVRRRRRWVWALVGRDPAPRAWDHLFADRPVGWVRLKLKSGTWLAGAFAADGDGRRRSYAAGYPEAPTWDR